MEHRPCSSVLGVGEGTTEGGHFDGSPHHHMDDLEAAADDARAAEVTADFPAWRRWRRRNRGIGPISRSRTGADDDIGLVAVALQGFPQTRGYR